MPLRRERDGERGKGVEKRSEDARTSGIRKKLKRVILTVVEKHCFSLLSAHSPLVKVVIQYDIFLRNEAVFL